MITAILYIVIMVTTLTALSCYHDNHVIALKYSILVILVITLIYTTMLYLVTMVTTIFHLVTMVTMT